MRKTQKFQDMKYLSSENFARINRKPNCLYVGRSYIYSSSFTNLSHFQEIILKANYPPSSNKPGFCLTTTIDTINKFHRNFPISMARKINMLVRMDKKGISRTIIALTPRFTSDPNYSSVSFRLNFISSFLDVLSLFLFRMGLR